MKLSQPSKYVKLLLDDLVSNICSVVKDIELEKFAGRGCFDGHLDRWREAQTKWDNVKQEIIDIVEEK